MEENLRLSCSCRIVGVDIYSQDIVFGAVVFLPRHLLVTRQTGYGKGFADLCEELPMVFSLWV